LLETAGSKGWFLAEIAAEDTVMAPPAVYWDLAVWFNVECIEGP